MVATSCPTADELKNYTLGRLSEQDWAAIGEHIESCPHCQAAIATVDDVADTLLTQLRNPAPDDSVLNESQCEAALERAKDIEQGKMPASFPDAKQFGEYRVLEELGQGGMGAVYRALHTKLDRVVAIKILSRGRSGDDRAIARFEREMKAVGRFDHPHIVRAYDAREIGGSPVLIMEFVEGMDLGCLVRRLGPLPVADACELVRQAAVGLQYVHEQGLVHRDIKPSNLMLTPQGIVKILDLGLARFHFDEKMGTGSERSEAPVPFFSEITNTGQTMGTVDYMAPEQASDSHAVDIRADIYSLGCTLYKLLSGSAPFEGSQYKGTFEKMTAHVQQPALPIENILPDIPPKLAAVVEKMLAKNPADRYAQPADVIEALTPFCTNAALSALLKRAEETQSESPLSLRENPNESPLSLRERARVRADQVAGALPPAPQPARRRTSILAAIGLMLFALGFGVGYSLGIMVTIKKGGETTTIKVPDGSDVNVNEQGNVTVDMDKNKDAKEYAQIPNPPYPVYQVPDGFRPAVPLAVPYKTGQYAPIVPNIEQPANEGKKPGQEKQRRTAGGKIVPDTYRLGPGDILWIYRIRGGGGHGQNSRFLFGQNGIEISKTGTIYLGSKYRDVNLQGLSLDEAERAIEKKIRNDLDKYSPKVSITIADNEMKQRQLPDSYSISPGDIMSLHISAGPGGGPENTTSEVKPDDKFNGLTIKEAEEKVRDDLIEFMNSTKIEITLQSLRKTEQNPPESQNKSDSHRIDLSAGSGSAKAELPPEPYTIAPNDVLHIHASGTIPDQPINSHFMVEHTGTVAFGPTYGRVKVQGLSLVEAEKVIQENLKKVLRQPEVSVTLAAWVDRSAMPSPIPDPYIIGLGDTLQISAVGTIPDQPINELFVVEPMGTVALSPAYGRVNVQGLSIEQAEKTVENSLKKILREPIVSISLARWNDPSKNPISPQAPRIAPGDILDIWANGTIPDQPIHGPYLVESDGQVTLGPAYGRVNLKGLTFEEAEKIVAKQLMQILRQPEVSITLKGWRGMPTPSAKETQPRYRTSTSGKNQPQIRIRPRAEENPALPPLNFSFGNELDRYISDKLGLENDHNSLKQNPPDEMPNYGIRSLQKAVNEFNQNAAQDKIGRLEPPLTEDEVIAAIRGWDRANIKVDDQTYAIYQKIADTKIMPSSARLRFGTHLSTDKYDYTVWWIDLLLNTGKNTGYNFRIRARTINSISYDSHNVDLPMNPPAVSPEAEMKSLQGRWKVVNIEKEKDERLSLIMTETEGKVMVTKPLYINPDTRFIFAEPNGWMEIVDFKDGTHSVFDYRVNLAATPKIIDFYRTKTEIEQNSKPGAGHLQLTALGIYEISGDVLKICLISDSRLVGVGRRPENMASDSENIVITLKRSQPSDDEMAMRRGVWDVVRLTIDGKNVNEDGSKNAAKLYFTRNVSLDLPLFYVYQDKKSDGGRFDLDPDSDPKKIKILPELSAKPLLFKSLTSGIYKLEGDRLWIAFRQRGPAPEKFESTPGSGVTLLELQRSEPKKEEQAEPKASGQLLPVLPGLPGLPSEKAETTKEEKQDENK